MELLETILEEQFSENQLLFQIFQDMFQDGNNQLLLEDMLMEINTEPLMLLFQDQESLRSFIHQKMEVQKLDMTALISQVQVFLWVCTTQMIQSEVSLTNLSNSHSQEIIHFTCLPRTQY
jgi:hypothetical protein